MFRHYTHCPMPLSLLTTAFESINPITRQNNLGSLCRISVGEKAAHIVAVINKSTNGQVGAMASRKPLFFPVPSRYDL